MRVDPGAEHDGTYPTGNGFRLSVGAHRGSFLDEEWLTPIQIAHKFGYATDKPIRKAIMRGELKATRAPCRRKLVVAESEVLRWIDRDLAYEPAAVAEGQSVNGLLSPKPRNRRRALPTLSYESERGGA